MSHALFIQCLNLELDVVYVFNRASLGMRDARLG